MKSPYPYFGGKSRVASLVWSRFGSVPNYVEPFFGSGAVLLAREDWEGRIETINDLDCYVSNFWRAVQNAPEAVAQHADFPVLECDLHARHNWLVNSESSQEFREKMKTAPDFYDAKIAGWWVWGISQWIGDGWCVSPEYSRANAGRAARGIQALESAVASKRPCLHHSGRGTHRASLTPSRKLPILGNCGVGVHASTRSGKRPSMTSRCGVHQIEKTQNGIYEYFDLLCERMRRVRVCSGDWTRVVGPAVTTCIGATAVFLDPPYDRNERADVYSVESDVSSSVREWAIGNGDNPLLKIALCGYDTEHQMPSDWECVAWKANGGYGANGNGRGKENATRERIWFSPSCLKPQAQLFDFEYSNGRNHE